MSVMWVGAAVAVAGAASQANSASKARKAQEQSAREANQTAVETQQSSQDFQQRQADQARADREPWRAMGANKLAELGQRTASGGDLARTFGMADFQADPGYQFRLAEGQKALTNMFASRGNLLSGAAMKAAPAYSQNLASSEYGNAYNRFQTNQTNQFNRLASLADVGQVAANQNASSAMQLGGNVANGMYNMGNNIAQNQIGAGNARASGYLAQGNALVGGLNQGVSAWRQYDQNQTAANASGAPFQANSTWINNNGGGF